jgi:hypothetical protein
MPRTRPCPSCQKALTVSRATGDMVACPHCQAARTAHMSPGFARVYLWACQLATDPAYPEARWLVALLRQWDDRERSRQAWPEATATNLQGVIEENILILVRQLRRTKGGAA